MREIPGKEASSVAVRSQPRQIVTVGSLLCLGLLLGACANTQRSLIWQTQKRLPEGRFTGPIELKVPKQDPDPDVFYEYVLELEAACSPRLKVQFPDGEVSRVGEKASRWQNLLERRATAANVHAGAPGGARGGSSRVPPERDASPAPAPGRWQQVVQEDWPGQLEFQRQRSQRCARVKRFRKVYLTGFEELEKLSLWGEVPQELRGATVSLRVYELVDLKGRTERRERILARERKQAERRARAKRRRQEAANRWREAKTVELAKPRPAKPKAKLERPKPAKDPRARWKPGYWTYSGVRGKWVWKKGYWLEPQSKPRKKRGPIGVPPVVGARWKDGYWVWIPGNGSWRWTDGHWLAPPPKVEERPPAPFPEANWISGVWQRRGASFVWIKGRWGKPRPRKEVVPPPPYTGAKWRAGFWSQERGQWTWNTGSYDAPSPPPRKVERPGKAPVQGAVWLGGYWRWDKHGKRYLWVSGRWERPPGVGYVWVPDPVDPAAGISLGGRWQLRIKVSPQRRRR